MSKERYLEQEINKDLRILELERQLDEARENIETYKYDLETLANIVTDCVYNMSQEECFDTLKEVADHYKQLKEKEPQTYLGGLVDEHCDLIKETNDENT